MIIFKKIIQDLYSGELFSFEPTRKIRLRAIVVTLFALFQAGLVASSRTDSWLLVGMLLLTLIGWGWVMVIAALLWRDYVLRRSLNPDLDWRPVDELHKPASERGLVRGISQWLLESVDSLPSQK